MKKLILSYPGGNENVRASLRALQGAGMLARFCTTLAWRDDGKLARLLPAGLRAELRRRGFPGIDQRFITRFPAQEMTRQALRRIGLSGLTNRKEGWTSVHGVSGGLDRAVASLIAGGGIDAQAVYTYEHCARRSFAAARAKRLKCLYELTTGYWRVAAELFEEERQRQPEWSATIEAASDSPAKLAEKDAELSAADHVVVPSNFVRDTLKRHPNLTATIDVIPYGAPAPRAAVPEAAPPGTPLRLLYVGHLTQRKGVAYLFEAMEKLKGAATLTLVGAKPSVPCPALERALGRHNWLGRVTHDRVLEIMQRHDVFVFPSLFEGFGLVILEAMAQGLPVIATPNGGGPMVVADGTDGFIVPIRDADAIAERLMRLHGDRALLAAMKAAALDTARRNSWANYEHEFIRAVQARLGAG
ncbi:MAG TPA: glycosyltransferase family 4 protein [Stellaceae bacterium]|nr:glycosyltransferase family 4 protein [Stellaceae bacterium]